LGNPHLIFVISSSSSSIFIIIVIIDILIKDRQTSNYIALYSVVR